MKMKMKAKHRSSIVTRGDGRWQPWRFNKGDLGLADPQASP